jgi:hypothetical protein
MRFQAQHTRRPYNGACPTHNWKMVLAAFLDIPSVLKSLRNFCMCGVSKSLKRVC